MQGLSAGEIAMKFTREVFGGLNPRAALPRMRKIIDTWKPDLVVRESVEFSGAIAAEAAGLPHARVAVHCGLVEARVINSVAANIDSLRRETGLQQDAGQALRAAPAFTAFPATLDRLQEGTLYDPPFRSRDLDKPRFERSGRPAWMAIDWHADHARPLVYITFGTEAGTSVKTQAAYRAALEAVADAPVRALLTTGPKMEAANLGPVPSNVAVEQFVLQAEIFPYASAVVCHGGSGTLLGAAAAALPMVVIPLFADQPENARNLEAAGAGLVVATPEPSLIRDALMRSLSDGSLAEGARRVADEIAAMARVDDAIEVLLALASPRPRG
jgi:UDP:flavonoid glycosyltransferase YjiC (YdhE family)